VRDQYRRNRKARERGRQPPRRHPWSPAWAFVEHRRRALSAFWRLCAAGRGERQRRRLRLRKVPSRPSKGILRGGSPASDGEELVALL
jgi:hypothetical protein